MAEESGKKNKQSNQSNQYKLKVVSSGTNRGVQVLRFKKDDGTTQTFIPGQVITVGNGGKLTQKEGTRLQTTTSWKFERTDS
ncbi:hypothetical protein [Halobacillus sp. H74]|uniref:hypothetical protein n=1 Tax=Halobacillus sp. H74 TaxID=3457436 RepID=UPI003FCE1207